MKAGVVLSVLVVLTFLLNIPLVAALAGKPPVNVQLNADAQSDKDAEDGRDAPLLVSFMKKNILDPAFNSLAETLHVVTDSNQSPPDFPPESI